MTPSHSRLGPLSPKPSAFSRAEVFELLSNKRRRGIIHHLTEAGGEPATMDELIDAVVAWESDGATDEVSESQRASVYSSLMQTHLPRLEEAGVIEIDEESGLISQTERTREVELYLEYSPSRHIPWAEYYVGLCAVCAALVAVVWAELPPFDAVPGILVAAVVVALVSLSALAHLVQTRRSRLGSVAFERDLEAE